MDRVEVSIWTDEATRLHARRQKAAIDAAAFPTWKEELQRSEQKRLIKLMAPAKEDDGDGGGGSGQYTKAQEAEWARGRAGVLGLVGRKQR